MRQSTAFKLLFLLPFLFFLPSIVSILDETRMDMQEIELVDEHRLREIECLALNIYYEARGEPRRGQLAVANVTMNRVNSQRWPGTVCEVVYQKFRSTCQFSWVCMPSLPAVKHSIFKEIYEMAEKVYDGTVQDVSRGATHFHATYTHPFWADTYRVTTQIGNHIFYRR